MAANRTHTQFSSNRIRRIEAGALNFGVDMLPSNNSIEPGMARLISTDKADYIGKAAIGKILAEGSTRMMKGAFMADKISHYSRIKCCADQLEPPPFSACAGVSLSVCF